jgi:hypothetical protein
MDLRGNTHLFHRNYPTLMTPLYLRVKTDERPQTSMLNSDLRRIYTLLIDLLTPVFVPEYRK